ncbi:MULTISPECIES: dihydrofolate reductase family protein [Streptomyces]|uniref:dihydrofolate reductase family protein n=1 Tax=Streptomyces TaxID=1883 RepID=UPI0016718082|nr:MULTISPECIES: dihydrofolate reductase family protein [Streptomyces]UFR02407.1 dihydrofolate reductase family protein [Streptomyces sp. Go40/10]GGS98824.1 deaminase [Streptomyces cinerochromogenes]
MRKLSYVVACSLDGFIGDEHGDGSAMYRFLDEEFLAYLRTELPDALPTHIRRTFGIDDLENKRFDTVVQGRASYEVALREGITSPYGHLRELVASRTLGASPHPNVEIVADDLTGRVRALKAEDGGLDILLCGGSRIAGALLEEIDELVIKSYPLVYGKGMPMFGTGLDLKEFTLESLRTFDNGALVRTYGRKR